MLLNDEIPEHQAVPKEYDLELADSNVKNTFVFNERDLPRFAAREKARKEATAQDLPSHLTAPKDGRVEKRGGKGRKSYEENRHVPSKLVCLCCDLRVLLTVCHRKDQDGWQDPL